MPRHSKALRYVKFRQFSHLYCIKGTRLEYYFIRCFYKSFLLVFYTYFAILSIELPCNFKFRFPFISKLYYTSIACVLNLNLLLSSSFSLCHMKIPEFPTRKSAIFLYFWWFSPPSFALSSKSVFKRCHTQVLHHWRFLFKRATKCRLRISTRLMA